MFLRCINKILKTINLKLSPIHLEFGHDLETDILYIFKESHPKTIIDVGANTGLYVHVFKRLFPDTSLYCIEPASKTYNSLASNVSGYFGVHLFNLALGKQDGEQELNIYYDSVNNSLLEIASGEKAARVEKVKVQTLGTFCKNSEITSIDLLKVDTQGNDLEVLKSGQELFDKNLIKAVVVEGCNVKLYENNAYFLDIYQFMESQGFILMNYYPGLLNSNKLTEWGDALFCNQKLMAEGISQNYLK